MAGTAKARNAHGIARPLRSLPLVQPAALIRRLWTPRTGAQRVWALTALLVAAGATLNLSVLPNLVDPESKPWSWWAFAAAFCLAEIAVVHIHFRRDAHSFSLSEIPLVLGLFLLSPTELVIAQLLGCAVALVVHRRQSPLKLFFNLSHFVFETSVAIIVFQWLQGGAGHVDLGGWLAALVAALVSSILAASLIYAAIALSQGRPDRDQLAHTFAMTAFTTLTNTSIALIGLLLTSRGWHALVFLAGPALMLVLGYRGYVRERDRGESLEFLYKSMRSVHESPEMEAAMVALAQRAREMFRAERADVIVLRSAGEAAAASCTSVTEDKVLQAMQPADALATIPLLARALETKESVLLERNGHRYDVLQPLIAEPVLDLMLVPLTGENKTLGVMVVANRLGDVGTFGADDLTLFETLANHVAVSLENSLLEHSLAQVTELKEQLRHQALHDSLTGLPNRALFADRLDHALQRRADESCAAVVLIDLDDFKHVNDTLGHAAGDTLLVAVGQRLRATLRPHDTAARLGGDEFAVLLEEVTDVAGAKAAAERLLATFRRPFTVEGREVIAQASIGVALRTDPTIPAEQLVRNADVAMYAAKSRGKGAYEIFHPEMHEAALARLEIGSDLQRGLERDEFELHYQPIVDLTSGGVRAVEALIRWRHHRKGVLAPDQFIPLAEENGLILQLGAWVLRQACSDLRRWQERYPADAPSAVSVNVSARQFRDPEFVTVVRDVLAEAQVDPRSLILEITESLLLDERFTSTQLKELQALGVHLAIDDFGTGYSSLSYLGRYPVDILKVDKGFLRGVGDEQGGGVLARAVIELSRALGMETIAEGIETEQQLEWLRVHGCALGQGFLFSRPLTRAAMDDMLSSPVRLVAARDSALSGATSAA